MTKQEITEKFHKFIGCILREKEIRDKLSLLKFQSKDLEVIKDSLEQQDALIAEMEAIHKNEVFPIMEEIAAFMSKRKKEIEAERGKPLTDEEFTEMMEIAGNGMLRDPKVKELFEVMTEPEDDDEE